MSIHEYPNAVGTFLHVGSESWGIDGNGESVAEQIAADFAEGKPSTVKVHSGPGSKGGEIILVQTGAAIWLDHPQNSRFW